jgi:hypothetical protein
MGKPDALSRQADHRSGQGDNDNLTLLYPPNYFASMHSQVQDWKVMSETSCEML